MVTSKKPIDSANKTLVIGCFDLSKWISVKPKLRTDAPKAIISITAKAKTLAATSSGLFFSVSIKRENMLDDHKTIAIDASVVISEITSNDFFIFLMITQKMNLLIFSYKTTHEYVTIFMYETIR